VDLKLIRATKLFPTTSSSNKSTMNKLLTTTLIMSLVLPSSATLSGRLRGGGNETLLKHRALKTDKSGTTGTDTPLCCVPTAIEDEQYRRDCLALDPNECANGNIVSDVGASGTTCLAPEIWEGRPQEFWEDYCNPEVPPPRPPVLCTDGSRQR